MTVVTMVWVQEHVHEVRNATKAVLSYLAFKAHYDDGTAAWPAIGTIAGACGLSEKTVQRSIDQLLDLGLLEPGQQTFSAINPKTGKPVRRNYQTVVWNVICKDRYCHIACRALQGIEPADRTVRGPERVQGPCRDEARGQGESQNAFPGTGGRGRRRTRGQNVWLFGWEPAGRDESQNVASGKR